MKSSAIAMISLGFVFLCGGAGANAGAERAIGLWRVADGSATIEIKACGPAICGFVASAPAPWPGEASAVGQKILIDLKRDGEVWRGPINDIDNGATYDGEVSLIDDGRLQVKGCLPHGGVCGGETWKRER